MLKPPSNPEGVVLFASRRPDWALANLEDIHSDLRLTPASQELAGQRKPCPKCSRSRALYCYDCLLPMVECPQVHLPFKISIITHTQELASKNTGIQAYLLAPDHVDLHDIDNFPGDYDPHKSIVLFPSDDAVTIDQLEPGSVDRAIIIDSAWRKAKELLKHSAFAGVRRVRLAHTKSAFWRFHTQGVSEDGVCTVEALLHLLRGMVQHNKLAAHQLPVEATTNREETHSQPNAASAPEQQGSGSDGPSQPGDQAQADTQQLTACHAYDDLMWFFVQQHRHIQAVAERRLAERKVNREAQGTDVVVERKKKHKSQ